jgi:hypothetical protein
MDVTGLTAWLRAQDAARERELDEDERVARAAEAEPWHFYPDGHYGAVAEFLNRWNPVDPHRVLAEINQERADIAVKRAILDLHTPHVSGYCCPVCWIGAEDGEAAEAPCQTVRLLVRPYAGRDGWREEWAVQ